MDARNALKWTLIHRGISMGALIVGLVIIVFGISAAFADALSVLIDDPLNPGDAVSEANPVLAIGSVVVGILVWRIGRTFATFWTMPNASSEAVSQEVNTERVKSEILEVLDDRLSEMQVEIEETRRAVQELKRAEHAAEFDESDYLDSEPEAKSGSNTTGTSTGEASLGSTADTSQESTPETSRGSTAETARETAAESFTRVDQSTPDTEESASDTEESISDTEEPTGSRESTGSEESTEKDTDSDPLA